ncbi:MAG: threonylcarbamoyl-AMP synthase [Candidatus Doudnabacteria bacterium RIFCSPHIGHO2_01_52_17]|uniref:L-threonylcarbamoyladenylate synthase n=1 Tax=Candidatus Doudnabacteria bacterium RIFCSPHIGHO2_01_52_17 TaxID=1817820 RepID=A0A1F5NFC9_9BACT|nr:MAG: threonylcarbamoyl-AMP synthase [Candidatus Doudnabacteria bacterium RIFCSPHIGHO2_01_52_17]
MRTIKANKKAIEIAVQYLRAGKSVVYPTDTAYGLGVDATNVKAVRKLYKIKERTHKQPVHVIVADLKMARKYATMNALETKLFRKFLLGPLTLILSREGRGKAMGVLSAGTGTIGIRIPKNAIALTLVKKLGKPITTTSANPAGGPTPYSIKDSLRQFSGKKHQPDLFVDADRLPRRKPSTIVSVKGNKIKVIREGPISKSQILKRLRPFRQAQGGE